jgi:gluconate 2-dehydrogenase gamma chain
VKKVESQGSRGETDPSRREVIALLTTVPLSLMLGCTPEASQRVSRFARQVVSTRSTSTDFKPTFFTSHEYQTVRELADLIIPRDERSGSATDAGVPEFMDVMMADQDTSAEARTAMRGGLAWIDAECDRRFGKHFIDCAWQERTALLDEIAWPKRARPEMSHGVAFFNVFRDLTATGFWSSEMGVKDLRYQGNSFVPAWTGCPDAALQKIGVRYDDQA